MIFDQKSHRRRTMNEQNNNGSRMSLSQALDLIKSREGKTYDIEKVNLAELQRLTGITRAKLRRLKKNGFVEKENGNKGKKANDTVLSGYTSVLDNFLRSNLTNSQVCYARLIELGYKGSWSTVRAYIARHKDLIPAARQIVTPQGNRGKRFSTEPGQSYQIIISLRFRHGGEKITNLC